MKGLSYGQLNWPLLFSYFASYRQDHNKIGQNCWKLGVGADNAFAIPNDRSTCATIGRKADYDRRSNGSNTESQVYEKVTTQERAIPT